MQPPPSDAARKDVRLSAPRDESFWHLLYRYRWPYIHFRDITHGSLLERRQNYRHNLRMGIHLPGFMAHRACLALTFLLLGMACEELLALMLSATRCYMTGTWVLAVCIHLLVAYLWLRRFPDLH